MHNILESNIFDVRSDECAKEKTGKSNISYMYHYIDNFIMCFGCKWGILTIKEYMRA